MVCVVLVQLLVCGCEVLEVLVTRVNVMVAAWLGMGVWRAVWGGWERAGKEGYGLGKGVWDGNYIWMMCSLRA